ncbi:MAG: hypothetical protein AMXMBFR57_01440 [Acidimicrobiia bacterium]
MGVAPLVAVASDRGQYVGGTLTTVKEKAEAKFDSTSTTELVFDAGKKGRVTIPYANIQELEYGQKAGRRVATAILLSPLALFSKGRKHYFTITFKDATGADQVAVFELGKNLYRPLMKTVEVRSGKEILLQDTEACKQYKTAKECEAGK